MNDAVKSEKKFRKFQVRFETDRKNEFEIHFYDATFFRTSYVGCIMGKRIHEFYEITKVMLDENYQDRGYSKFLYKKALELAHGQGLEGLIVGKNLFYPEKSFSTYRNFYRYAYYPPDGHDVIVLSEWKGKKIESRFMDSFVKYFNEGIKVRRRDG